MCTNLRVTAEDGTVVVARSMEFGLDLGWQLMVSPAGNEFVGTTPDGEGHRDGHRWTARYGSVGVVGLGRQLYTDGLNEAGLFAGALYLPGLAGYESADGVDPADCLSIDEVTTLVLTRAATVDEAIELTESIVVWNRVEEQLGDILPLHLVVHDRSGACVVIEWIDGVRTAHRSPIGVCTNNPSYDWHLMNLRNYVNLQRGERRPGRDRRRDVRGARPGHRSARPAGGLDPASRLVRAAALSAATFAPKDSVHTVTTALHMINTFDIPLGLVRSADANEYTDGSASRTSRT